MKKLKELLEEAFEGVGGIVTLKPIHDMKGAISKSTPKVNEGPSYEYENYIKKIQKAENNQAKEVNNLVKLLGKNGFKKEATLLGAKYMKGMRDFNDTMEKLYRKLV